MKKMIWFMLPTAFVHFFALLVIILTFGSVESSVAGYIMEHIFQNNALNMVAALIIYCMLASALSITGFVLSLTKKWDALELAKTAMIIKLFQAPLYIVVFAVAAVLMITIFTFAFSVGLFLIDCLALALTGLMTISAAVNAVRSGILKSDEVIWVILLQFVFCADIVVAIIFHSMLKKRYTAQITSAAETISEL